MNNPLEFILKYYKDFYVKVCKEVFPAIEFENLSSDHPDWFETASIPVEKFSFKVAEVTLKFPCCLVSEIYDSFLIYPSTYLCTRMNLLNVIFTEKEVDFENQDLIREGFDQQDLYRTNLKITRSAYQIFKDTHVELLESFNPDLSSFSKYFENKAADLLKEFCVFYKKL